jgi:hypothetical protein
MLPFLKQLRLIFLFTNGMCLGTVLSAQHYVDLLRLTALQTPPNDFDSSDVSAPLREIVADATVPLRLNDRLNLLTGGLFHRIETRLDESQPDVIKATDGLLKVGVNIKLNDWSNLTCMMLPRYCGDGGAWSRRDMQLGAMAIYKLKKSPRLTWQFGAMYNGELFGPFFVPLLGFYARSESLKWEANFFLPVSADLNYSVNSKFRLGIAFASGVKSFYVNEAMATYRDLYWVKSTNEGYGYLQFEPIQGFVFQSRFGHSVARKYTLYNASDRIDWALMSFKFGDDRTRLNTNFADGLIFQLRFIYRFYTEEKKR